MRSGGTAVALNVWPRGFVMVVVTDGRLNCANSDTVTLTQQHTHTVV